MNRKKNLGQHIVVIGILPFIMTSCSTEPIGRWLINSGLGYIILGVVGIAIVMGILDQIFAKGNIAAALVVIAIIVVIFLLLR